MHHLLALLVFHLTLADFKHEDDLVLVHVLFRHGNRTTASTEFYPNDPYKNDSFYPYGPGELKNVGKNAEFNIGKELANAYRPFFGEIYTPDLLYAQSTNVSRTKSSLELVLAGLFPPVRELVWNKLLPWQPIPYNYMPTTKDNLLSNIYRPEYKKAYKKYMRSDKYKKKLRSIKDVLAYLTKHTGKDIKGFDDVYNLYFCLKTEEEFGLQLPKWTKSVFPNPIEKIAISSYSESYATDILIKNAVGHLLTKIIDDTKAKLNGSLKPAGRKLFLYSAHERNIAQLLIALGVFDPHVPPYGSYIVMEVHKMSGKGKYGIKVLYQDYTQKTPKILTLPKCKTICPLDNFIKTNSKYLF